MLHSVLSDFNKEYDHNDAEEKNDLQDVKELKNKNDKLRKLVEKNIDIPAANDKSTFQKRNFLSSNDKNEN